MQKAGGIPTRFMTPHPRAADKAAKPTAPAGTIAMIKALLRATSARFVGHRANRPTLRSRRGARVSHHATAAMTMAKTASGISNRLFTLRSGTLGPSGGFTVHDTMRGGGP
jgi:hypothetical protein